MWLVCWLPRGEYRMYNKALHKGWSNRRHNTILTVQFPFCGKRFINHSRLRTWELVVTWCAGSKALNGRHWKHFDHDTLSVVEHNKFVVDAWWYIKIKCETLARCSWEQYVGSNSYYANYWRLYIYALTVTGHRKSSRLLWNQATDDASDVGRKIMKRLEQ